MLSALIILLYVANTEDFTLEFKVCSVIHSNSGDTFDIRVIYEDGVSSISQPVSVSGIGVGAIGQRTIDVDTNKTVEGIAFLKYESGSIDDFCIDTRDVSVKVFDETTTYEFHSALFGDVIAPFGQMSLGDNCNDRPNPAYCAENLYFVKEDTSSYRSFTLEFKVCSASYSNSGDTFDIRVIYEDGVSSIPQLVSVSGIGIGAVGQRTIAVDTNKTVQGIAFLKYESGSIDDFCIDTRDVGVKLFDETTTYEFHSALFGDITAPFGQMSLGDNCNDRPNPAYCAENLYFVNGNPSSQYTLEVQVCNAGDSNSVSSEVFDIRIIYEDGLSSISQLVTFAGVPQGGVSQQTIRVDINKTVEGIAILRYQTSGKIDDFCIDMIGSSVKLFDETTNYEFNRAFSDEFSTTSGLVTVGDDCQDRPNPEYCSENVYFVNDDYERDTTVYPGFTLEFKVCNSGDINSVSSDIFDIRIIYNDGVSTTSQLISVAGIGLGEIGQRIIDINSTKTVKGIAFLRYDTSGQIDDFCIDTRETGVRIFDQTTTYEFQSALFDGFTASSGQITIGDHCQDRPNPTYCAENIYFVEDDAQWASIETKICIQGSTACYGLLAN